MIMLYHARGNYLPHCDIFMWLNQSTVHEHASMIVDNKDSTAPFDVNLTTISSQATGKHTWLVSQRTKCLIILSKLSMN